MKLKELFSDAIWVRPTVACHEACFKSSFTADSDKKTEITICGLGFYKLYINGRKVGDDELAPVTSFYHDRKELWCRDELGEKISSRIYAERKDIGSYIKNGENEITVEVGLGWYFEFGDRPVVIWKIQNGDKKTFSDENVLWARGPVTEMNFHKYQYQDYLSNRFDPETGNPTEGFEKAEPAEIPDTEYFISNCPNDKIIRSLEPKIIKETVRYRVYDIGENITGNYVFICPKANKKIEVACGEEIDSRNNPVKKYLQQQVSYFITDGSDREYGIRFNWAAFRYIKISKPAELIRADVIHTAVKPDSEFSCENKTLNWLYDSFIRTQLCNMHAGIPSDCPHLERRGYTGDGQLVSETGMLTLDTKEFYLKWMEDISDCQDILSGHIQYTAPYHRCGGGPGGWGCAIAMVPYNFFRQYGDIEPMKKYYPQALRYLDYLEAHSENDLVVSDQPGLWCLGDWCTPHDVHGEKPRIPEPFVNTYFYIKTIDILLETASMTGNEDKIDFLKEIRAKKVNALNTAYFNAETGSFADNKNSANAFALDIGLGNEKTLAECLRHTREDTPDLGIFGIEILTRVLCEKGFAEDAVRLLAREEYPSFGFMMQSGATTLWEEWKEPRSMSHPMFGAPVKILFQYILGIRQAKGRYGLSEIIVSPFVNEITGDATGFITTEKGAVKVKTNLKSGTYTITIPDGVKALCSDADENRAIEKGGTYTFSL